MHVHTRRSRLTLAQVIACALAEPVHQRVYECLYLRSMDSRTYRAYALAQQAQKALI